MTKPKIALILFNTDPDLKVPPFPLLFLSHSLKQENFEIKIFHPTKNKMKQTVEEILAFQPLYAGFSVITGIPTLYSAEMSQMIKTKSKIPIIWGGIHTSILPEECLKENYIDFVVIGDGEKTLLELSQEFLNNQAFDKIKGIGYKKNGNLIFTEMRPMPKDLSAYKIDLEGINWNKYIDIQEIEENGKIKKVRSLGYYSSRGCPHNCGFCYNLAYNNRLFRAHTVSSVLEDIEYLKKKYKIEKVHFWDDNFFANPKRAIEILEKIKLYSGIDIRIDYIKEELAQKLVDLKVKFLLIGGESGSNRILKMINKDFTLEKMYEKIKILAKYKIPTLYSFIIGYPTETKEELNQTLDFMLKIYKTHSQASFTIGAYLPYPGTKLYDLCLELGFKPPQNTSDWNLVDRWRNTVGLPWLERKIALNIRHLFAFLDFKNKIIKNWAYFRLKHKIIKFDLDLKLIIKLSKFLN